MTRAVTRMQRKRWADLPNSTQRKAQLARVYTRDHGICWLCGKYVELPDASRDHVIELQKATLENYLELRDDNNVRLSHRLCNASRVKGYGRGQARRLRNTEAAYREKVAREILQQIAEEPLSIFLTDKALESV